MSDACGASRQAPSDARGASRQAPSDARGASTRAPTGDGNGWVVCDSGHRHWGRFGAAGILVTDGRRVVLQHRALQTHEGGTWALPGGARDSHENAAAAALREAVEETTLDIAQVTLFGEWVDEHGGWSYTTVLARTDRDLKLESNNWESVEVRWWTFDDVAGLPLHSGFAAAWPHLRKRLPDPGAIGHQ